MSDEVEKLIQEWSNVLLKESSENRTTSTNINIAPQNVIDIDKEAKFDKAAAPTPNIDNAESLTQHEIDSLLGISQDTTPLSGGFNLLADTRNVGKNKLVLLDIIYARLVRRASSSLRKFSSDSIDIHLEQSDLIRFGRYLNSINLPAMVGVFRAEEWDNYGLITLDSDLIYSIIEVLLGGHRSRSVLNRSRAFTQLDSALVEKFISVILDDLTAAFDPINPVSFRLERIESNPRFAAFTGNSNLSHLGQFQIEIDDRTGLMEILFPLSTLEPVRDILTQSFLGEKFGRDTAWESHFRDSIKKTFVSLDTMLADRYLPLTNVLSWKVGDVIVLGTKPADPVVLSCNGKNMFRGIVGQKGGKIAVKINEKVKYQNRNNASALI